MRKKKLISIVCLFFAFFIGLNFKQVYAADKKGVEKKIQTEIFQKNSKKSIDLSSYNLNSEEVKKVVDNVLKDNNCQSLVKYSVKTGKDQKVTTINVKMDAAFEAAVAEIDTLNEKMVKEDGDSTQTDPNAPTKEEVIAAYAKLQKYYESNPDYFGVPMKFFYKKDSDEKPLGALAALAGKEYEDFSMNDAYYIITNYQSVLENAVEKDGQKLLKMRDKFLSKLDDSMTEVEKYLVLNDYMANNTMFDEGFFSGQQDTRSSTAFGPLVDKKGVCIGYASAYAYLIQCMHPEIYKNPDGSWKTKYEVGDNGIVDYACYTKSHYVNVVKIDGKWYYLDSNFNDFNIEEMQRFRVEADGNCSHNFLLYTEANFEKWSQQSKDQVDSAYTDLCTDDTYEKAWFSSVNSQIPYNNQYWFYVKPQTDTRDLMQGGTYVDKRDQLMCRNRKTGAIQTLVDYETGKVWAPDGRELGVNQEIAKEYKKDVVYNKIYPGLQHGVGLYENALYFNLGNKIYKYQLNDGKIVLVKEYNDITATKKEDGSVEPQSYYLTTNGSLKFKELPIAAITIKDDGQIYVSLATNLSKSTNYKSEVVNYIPYYGWYGDENKEKTSFEKCANIKDIFSITHFAGDSHTYKKVTVQPTCQTEGFEEERCTQCGRIKEGSRKRIANPLSHQYEYNEAEETSVCKTCKRVDAEGINYQAPKFEWADDASSCIAVFTDANGGNEKRITCSIALEVTQKQSCEKDEETTYTATANFDNKDYTDTKKLVTKKATGHQYGNVKFTWNGVASCKAEMVCTVCGNSISKDCTVEEVTGNKKDSTCAEEGYRLYRATVEFNGKTYTEDKKDPIAKKAHTYGAPTFNWSDDKKTCKAVFTCSVCGDKHEEDCNVTANEDVKATCDKDGKVTYTAICIFKEKNYSDKKTDVIKATGHQYTAAFTWSKDYKTCTVKVVCSVCKKEETGDAKVSLVETKEATDTESGYHKYKATYIVDGKEFSDEQKEIISAKGHEYNTTPVFKWSDDYNTCVAEFTCASCGDVQKVTCAVSSEETEKATCEEGGETVYTATCRVDGKGYTNVKTVKVKAKGHQYDEVKFKWSDDYKTCKAEATCKECGKKVTPECKIEKIDSESKEATDTEGGYNKFKVTAVLDGKEYSEEKTQILPAKGHKYGKPVFTWSDDHKSCVAEFTCASCGDVQKSNCKINNKATAATCDKDGKVTYTATCKFKEKNYSDTKTDVIKATGHSFDKNGVCKKCKSQMISSVYSSGKNMTVTWKKAAGVSGYYVYRSTDGKKFTKVKTIKGNSTVKYSDTKANKNGQKYVYKVSAYTTKSGKTKTSITSKTKTGYFLTTPKVTSAKNEKGAKATVAWSTNSKASGYQIEYTVNGGKSKTIFVSAKKKNATISKLTKNKTYTIRVRSYKTVSKTKYYSAWSSKKSVKVNK